MKFYIKFDLENGRPNMIEAFLVVKLTWEKLK